MEHLNTILGKYPLHRQQPPEKQPASDVVYDEEEWNQPPRSSRTLPEQSARYTSERYGYSTQPQDTYSVSSKRNMPDGRRSVPGDQQSRYSRYEQSNTMRPSRQPEASQEEEQDYYRPQPSARGRSFSYYPNYEEEENPRRAYSNTRYYAEQRAPVVPVRVYDNEVEEESQDEDLVVGMVVGDWEDDSEDIYTQIRNARGVRSSGVDYPAIGQELAPAREQPSRQPHGGYNPRIPAPRMASAPVPQEQIQNPTRQRPITQPLNPQMVSLSTREIDRVQEPPKLPSPRRKTRDMVRRDPVYLEQQVTRIQVEPLAKEVCSRCRGAGFLRADVPYGHPNFGKPIPCECKQLERKEKRRQQLREMSNLDAFVGKTFQTFNYRAEGVQEAYTITREYAENPEGWLVLLGPNGCGKTHLAASIAHQCLERGSVVLFSVVPDLLDHLRAAFMPTATEVYDQLFSKMREAEVLILDDLGAHHSSPWATEKLFQLLNYRYNREMPTVITANPRGLQALDDRVRSRMSDAALVIKVSLERASDYRPRHGRS